jgi:hypothetical protein
MDLLNDHFHAAAMARLSCDRSFAEAVLTAFVTARTWRLLVVDHGIVQWHDEWYTSDQRGSSETAAAARLTGAEWLPGAEGQQRDEQRQRAKVQRDGRGTHRRPPQLGTAPVPGKLRISRNPVHEPVRIWKSRKCNPPEEGRTRSTLHT